VASRQGEELTPIVYVDDNKYLGWFDRILAYKPGFRRYVYGLARYIKHY